MTTVAGGDSRLPLPQLVRLRATEAPDRVALSSVGQGSVTWAELADAAHAWAVWLSQAGVKRNDRVVTLVPQSLEAAYVWLACSELGAVEVSINPEFRGAWLSHAIQLSQASVVVATRTHLPQLRPVAHEIDVKTVLVYDADEDVDPGLPFKVITAPPFSGDRTEDWAAPTALISDIACVLYTSGTTGPAKAVQVPWGLLHGQSTVDPLIDPENETFYVPYPPHHLSGRSALYRGAITGGHTVVREQFSTSHFWRDIRDYGCTWTLLYAAPTRFVAGLPAAPNDRDNPLRRVLMCPLVPEVDALKARFDFDVYSVYGMTEVGSPLRLEVDEADAARVASCGRPVPGVEARLVDDLDGRVPPGQPGELVLRSDLPWTFMTEYQGAPEATSRAWRNGWFHTGDVFIQDDDGTFRYVDRFKDMIRRRGENISSTELEAAVLSHPAVAAAAAVGIPSEFGDEEVLIAIVPAADVPLEPSEVLDHLAPIVPAFALPSAIRILPDLPRTQATQRVQKHRLRTEGLTPDTWRRPGQRRAPGATPGSPA